MLKKSLILFFAVIGTGFAQKTTFEERYRAGENELDSLNVNRLLVERKTGSESAFSSYDESVKSYPLSVIVIPEKQSDGLTEQEIIEKNPYSRLMMESIGAFFSKKNYELKTLDGEQKLNEYIQMQNDIAGKEDDLAYVASLIFGADVYVKYAGEFTRSDLRINLKAYEAVSGALMGSASENKRINEFKNLNDCIRSAAESASYKLESAVQAYQRKEINSGVKYKVIINVSTDFDEEFVEGIQELVSKQLPREFKSISFNVMTDRTIDMTVYANPAVQANSQEVYKVIRSKLKKIVGVKKNNITKNLILIDLKRALE